MRALEPGQEAPDFTLDADDGSKVQLSSLRGRSVVLYFYPKDDTPGCTTQACGFRDEFPSFEKLDATVLGVSPDDGASHRAFKGKFGLPFALLSDPDHKVAESYGAWGKKNLYGREFEGILRSTFVIDAEGRVKKIFRNVRVNGHVEKVMEALSP